MTIKFWSNLGMLHCHENVTFATFLDFLPRCWTFFKEKIKFQKFDFCEKNSILSKISIFRDISTKTLYNYNLIKFEHLKI